MSDNTLFAILFATTIASCTACAVSDKLNYAKVDAQTECVRRAFTNSDRVDCLKAKP